MSTLSTIASTDTLNPTSLSKINTNFDTLNTDKAEISGQTFTGDISVPDEVYGAWWDGSLEVPTKNAIYDKIQAMPALSDWDKGDIVVSASGATWTVDSWVITNAKMANVASATFKGRTTVGTGSPEDMTATQATALLNTATTSLKGLMSSADKTKLDTVSSWAWTFVGCSLYHTSSQTFGDISLTYAIFNSEFFDTDWFHDTAVNNSRITIPTWKAWKYFVCWNIQTWTFSATWRFTIRLAKNWTLTWICQESYWLATDIYSNTGWLQISTIMDLSVWDYIELWLACNWVDVVSDASLNTNKNFSVYKIW